MRMSHLFSQTLREAPADIEAVGYQLLLRAGFLSPLAPGLFAYLPLGQRALEVLGARAVQALRSLGGQPLALPLAQPPEVLSGAGAHALSGERPARFQDQAGRRLAVTPDGAALVAELARREIHSYRQLPQLLYQVQPKWRESAGLHGAFYPRSTVVVSSYSLDADEASAAERSLTLLRAWEALCSDCDLPVTRVISGESSEALVVLTPRGEEPVMLCDACGYAAEQRAAAFRKAAAPPESPAPLEKVATPGVKTIEALSAFLNIPPEKTAKAVFMVAVVVEQDREIERFVFAVVRGDMEVNESKVAAAVGALSLRPATEAEIRAIGAEPGYGSPLGVHDALVLVDESVVTSPNLVAGANEEGAHLRNVNYGRDFRADWGGDLALARPGAACPRCGAPLRLEEGVVVAALARPDVPSSRALGCEAVDRDGTSRPVLLGGAALDLGRLLACLAELHHDDQGLIWPLAAAPYALHLVALPGDEAVTAAAERLYEELRAAGVAVLYDDREESPGVKFMDADLIGLPLRLTVGRRGLQQGNVELKHRDRDERIAVPLADAVARVRLEAGR